MAKDSAAAKAARVKLQLRDKNGQWVEMGGGAKWIDKKSNAPEAGTIVGFDGNYVLVAQKPANATAEPAPMRIPIGSLETYKIKGNLDPYYKSQIDKYLGNMSKNEKQELEAREKSVAEGKKAELDGTPELVKDFIEIFDEDDDTDGKFETVKLHELKQNYDQKSFITEDGTKWIRAQKDFVVPLEGEGEMLGKGVMWHNFEQKYVNTPNIQLVDPKVALDRYKEFKKTLEAAPKGSSITDNLGKVWTKDAEGDFTDGTVLANGKKRQPSSMRFHKDSSKIEIKGAVHKSTPLAPKKAEKVEAPAAESAKPSDFPEGPTPGKYPLDDYMLADNIQIGGYIHLQDSDFPLVGKETATYDQDVTGKIAKVTNAKDILGVNKTTKGKVIGSKIQYQLENGELKTADVYAVGPINKNGKGVVYTYDPNKSEDVAPVENVETPVSDSNESAEEVPTDTAEAVSPFATDVPAAKDLAPNKFLKSGVVLTPLADVEEGEEILAFKYDAEHPPKTPYSLSQLKLDSAEDTQFSLDESMASVTVGKKTPGKYAAVALPNGKTGYLGMTTLVVKASDNGKGIEVSEDNDPIGNITEKVDMLTLAKKGLESKIDKATNNTELLQLLGDIRLSLIQGNQTFGGSSGTKSEAEKAIGAALVNEVLAKLIDTGEFKTEALYVIGHLVKNGYGNPMPNDMYSDYAALASSLENPDTLNIFSGHLSQLTGFKKAKKAFEGKDNSDMTTAENLAAFKRHKALERSLTKLARANAADGEEAAPTELPVADVIDPTDPIDVTQWKKLSGPQGSNPGGIYEDSHGNQWYVKQSKSDDHAKNEVLADMLYTQAGIDVAGLRLADVGDGKLGTASPMIEGAKNNLGQMLNNSAYVSVIREGFAMDAWLANWDVLGLSYDNIVTDSNGVPVRVDPGGAMKYRAMGGLKTDLKAAFWGNKVLDWDSLRDPNVGTAAKAFNGITDEQMIESAAKVEAITPEMIDEMVAKLNMDSSEADILKARREDIIAKRDALKPAPEETPVVVDAPEAEVTEEAPETDAPVADAPEATTTTMPGQYPDKGKVAIGENGEEFKVNMQVVHPKYGPATITTILPSVNSAKIITTGGDTYTVGAKKIKLATADAPVAEVFGTAEKLGESGIDPVTGKQFIMAKEGTRVFVGSKISYSKKGESFTGTVTNLYPSSQQVKVTWDADSEGQAPVKKVSQLIATDNENKTVEEAITEAESAKVVETPEATETPEIVLEDTVEVEEVEEPKAGLDFFNDYSKGVALSNSSNTYQKTPMGWLEVPADKDNPIYSSALDLAKLDLPESAWSERTVVNTLDDTELEDAPNGSIVSSEKLGIQFLKDDDGDWGEDSNHPDYDYYGGSYTPLSESYPSDDWELELADPKIENNLTVADLDYAETWTELYDPANDMTFINEDGQWMDQNSGSYYSSEDVLENFPSSDWYMNAPEISADEYQYYSDVKDLSEDGEIVVGTIVAYSESTMDSPSYAMLVKDDENDSVWMSVSDGDGNIDSSYLSPSTDAPQEVYMKVEKLGDGTLNGTYIPDLMGGENAFELTLENIEKAPVGSYIIVGSNIVSKFPEGWFVVSKLGKKTNQMEVSVDKLASQTNFKGSYSPSPLDVETVEMEIGQSTAGLKAADLPIGTKVGYTLSSGATASVEKTGNGEWMLDINGAVYPTDDKDMQNTFDGANNNFVLLELGNGSAAFTEAEEKFDFPEMAMDYSKDELLALPIGATFIKSVFGSDTTYKLVKTNGVSFGYYYDSGNGYGNSTPFDDLSTLSSALGGFKLDKESLKDIPNAPEVEQAVTVTDAPVDVPETPVDMPDQTIPLKDMLKDNDLDAINGAPIGTKFFKASYDKGLSKIGPDLWQFYAKNGSVETLDGAKYDNETVSDSSMSGYKLVPGTAMSFADVEAEKLAAMTNVEKVEYKYANLPATWGEVVDKSALPLGTTFTHTGYADKDYTWVKTGDNEWFFTEPDGDTATKGDSHLSSNYKLDADSMQEMKAEELAEAQLADGLEVPGNVLGADIALADMDLTELAEAKIGTVIQMNKSNGADAGKFVKKIHDAWSFVPVGQDKKSPKSVKSSDFAGVLNSSSYNFVINPSPKDESEGAVEEVAPEVDPFYTKNVVFDDSSIASMPVGTVLKREGHQNSWDDIYHFIKEENGTWTRHKVNAQKTTKTEGFSDYQFTSGGYNKKYYAVSTPNPDKPGVVTGTGEIVHEGDEVFNTSTNETYTITKLLKTGINATDSDGNKLKIKAKDIGKNDKHTVPPEDTSQPNKVSFDNPVASYAAAQKVKEEAMKIISEFAGASASEYNEKGLGVHHSEAGFDNGIVVAPKKAVDKDNPLYGAEKPEAPVAPSSYPSFQKPSENLPKWDSSGWLKKVEDRYKANPNKAKNTVQESNKWGAISDVLEGSTNNLDSLLNSKYLDQEMYEEAKKAISDHNTNMIPVKKELEAKNDQAYTEYLEKKNEYLAEYTAKKEKYAADVEAWNDANPVADAIDPIVMPEASKTAYTGGEITGDEGPLGTLSANGAINAVKTDNVLAAKGLSFAVDSDMIEDFDVEVFRVIDDDGVQKLEYNMKVTAAHGAVVAATVQSMDHKSTNSIYLKHKAFDKITGLLKNLPGVPKTKSGGSFSTDGKRYTAKVENADITFQRSSNTNMKDMNVSSNNNSLRIVLPVDSDSSDLRKVLDSLGVKSTPTTSGDTRVLAENKLLKAFLSGIEYSGNTNVGGTKRASALAEIEKEYGVTVDNVVFTQDTNGRLKAVLDHETTVRLAKEYGYSSFRHSLSDENKAVENMISGKNPGLLSTYHRWGHGVDGEGMSSSTDMSYGSGDYIYITASSGDKMSHSGIFIHPEAIISRLDIWANPSDNYGKKSNNAESPHSLLKTHNHIHEILPKDTVPLKDIMFIRVGSSSTASEIIAKLKAKGITSINGMPLENFIISSNSPVPDYNAWQGHVGVISASEEKAISDVISEIEGEAGII